MGIRCALLGDEHEGVNSLCAHGAVQGKRGAAGAAVSLVPAGAALKIVVDASLRLDGDEGAGAERFAHQPGMSIVATDSSSSLSTSKRTGPRGSSKAT